MFFKSCRWLFVIIALATAGAGSVSARQNAVVTSELSLAAGDGCFISSEGARLWASLPEDEAMIRMEAEDATQLRIRQGQEPVSEDDCGGGAYIQWVKHAEYEFHVDKAGKYQGRARAYLPRAANWNHRESMDGGERRQFSESDRRIFRRWFWTDLGTYDLKAGDHTFVLHDWWGGARLDTILFSRDPEFDPANVGGVPASPAPSDSGTVTTENILPSGVSTWRRINFNADLNGGEIEVEVSGDGGRTWTAIGKASPLRQLPVEGDGTDSLMARFTLKAAPDDSSPVLKSAGVTYSLSPDAEVSIENPHYRIGLCRHTGRLCGIMRKEPRTSMSPPHLQRPFLALAVRKPGATEIRRLGPEEIEFEQLYRRGQGVEMLYSALDGEIRIRVRMTPEREFFCRWRIRVDNRSSMEVVRLDFPIVRDVAVGNWGDDKFVLPDTGGRIIDQPATGRTWKEVYLGGASMGWIDLCDDDAGLMLMMLDRQFTTTEMESAPAAGGRAVDMAMRTHTMVAPKQTKIRDYRMGIHDGDWHRAADAYRRWAKSWMKTPHNPQWLRDCDGWVGTMGLPFASMPDKLQQARRQGINYLQAWGQMSDGIDQCCGNFYWPAPQLGGAEGFRDGIAKVHDLGGRATAYMNCQTWTRDAPIKDALRKTAKSQLPSAARELIHSLDWFRNWRLYPLNGEPMGYHADRLGWYIMCPASTGFQRHLKFWIAKMYAQKFGMDGVYLDQTGATHAKPCYNLQHGHDDIGDWGAGNVQTLRESLKAAREVNPEFIMAIEGCGDGLGQYANLHLISGLCTDPRVYHYTFPNHILISGFSNRSHLSARQRVYRAFLNGDRFDSRTGRRGTGIVSALQLRRRIKRWLYRGRFMDTVGLSITDDRIMGRWNICDRPQQRAIVFTFNNEQKVEGAECSLNLPENWDKPNGLFIYDGDGDVYTEKPQISSGRIRFTVPATGMSAAALLYTTRPAHRIDAWQHTAGASGMAQNVSLNVVNLGGKAVECNITLQPQAPLEVTETTRKVHIDGGAVKRLQLAITGVRQLSVPAAVTAKLNWRGGETSTRIELRPLLLNRRLNIDDDGNDVPDFWRPGGTTSRFKRGIEDGAAWIQGQKEEYQYLIQNVPLQPQTAYHLAGEIKRSGQAKGVSIAVVEFVGEDGLRVHRIGKDPSAPAEEWQRFETTFTTGDGFRKCAVYLYNVHSPVRAWYRNIELRRK